MPFNASVEYVPLKNFVVADDLSWTPVGTHDLEEHDLEEVVSEHVVMFPSNLLVSSQELEEMKHATRQESILQMTMEYTMTGWPRYVWDLEHTDL